MKKTFTSLLALCLFTSVFGQWQSHQQLSEGGTPWSFKFNQYDSQVAFETMPSVNEQVLLDEDEYWASQGVKTLRFGYDHYVTYNLNNSGSWHSLSNGDQIWRIGISSPGAVSINLSFNSMNLPEGCRLFVYNEDKTEFHGAFTQNQVTAADQMLGTELLYGDKIIVELFVPQSALNTVSLQIWRVTHGYKDLRAAVVRSFGDAGSCQNNARCPSYAAWDDQIRSGICLVNGGEFCSAALINNTCNDGTPYVLTANHCGSSGFGSWVFRFNWEATGCTTPGSSPSSNSISGAVQRAAYPGADMSLLEMNSTPPASYNVYYAGWDRTNTSPVNPFCIHHPSGDIKKFSQSTGTGSTATYGSATTWRTPTWTDGVTEPGSSGSPLFNNAGLIIGQLYGGPSACNCENDPGCGYDYYGKVYTSWTGGGTNSTRLSNWLDACSTGSSTLNGYDPNAPTTALDAGISTIVSPADGVSSCQTSYTPTVVLRNYGTSTLTSVTVYYSLDGAAPTAYNWTGSLVTNASDTITLPVINVTAGAHTYTAYSDSPNGSADGNTANDSKTNSFTVVTAPAGTALPFTEGFEGTTFPPAGWVLTNVEANNTWTRVTTASGFGNSTASARMDNFSGSTDIAGQVDYLTTPTLDFSSAIAPVYLDFNVAYARYSASYSDNLDVTISTDCGATWTTIYSKGGTTLATAPDVTSDFVPTSTQWRAEQIDLSAYAGESSVMVRFENISGWGNHLYIDDINLYFPNTPPAADFSADVTTVCAGSSVTFTDLTTNTPTSWAWSFPGGTPATSTSQNPVVTYNTPGTYDVTLVATNSFGTDTEIKTAYITVNAIPSATAGSNSPVCSGNTIGLTANTIAGATYAWSGPNGFTSALEDPSISNATSTEAGTYTLVITENGCSSVASTTNVTVNTTPVATAGSNTPVCVGDAINLTANTIAGATYAWTGPNGFTSTSEDPTISGATTAMSGTYSVTITDNGCPGAAATATVLVTTAADPTINPVSPVCENASPVTLTAADAGGTWTASCGSCIDAATGSFDPVVAGAGTHTITYTISGSCGGTDTETITVLAGPAATAGSNSPVCTGGTLDLTANNIPTATYTWTGPNGFTSSLEDPSITAVTAAEAGTYTVTVTDNGCSSTSSVTVVISSGPVATSVVTPCTCAGTCDGLMTITVGGGTGPYQVNWCDGSTATVTTTGTVGGLCAGICTATITDSDGCVSSVSGTISEPAALSLSESHTNESATGNGTIDMTVSGGVGPYSVSWSNSETTEDLSGLTAGAYTATVTDANGCSATITVQILSTIGIDELTADNFILYPNPTNGIFTIELSKTVQKGKLSVFTPDGKLVYAKEINGMQTIRMNLDFAAGIYFAEMEMDGVKIVRKLVVK